MEHGHDNSTTGRNDKSKGTPSAPDKWTDPGMFLPNPQDTRIKILKNLGST